jgi:hypothetical protein
MTRVVRMRPQLPGGEVAGLTARSAYPEALDCQRPGGAGPRTPGGPKRPAAAGVSGPAGPADG